MRFFRMVQRRTRGRSSHAWSHRTDGEGNMEKERIVREGIRQ